MKAVFVEALRNFQLKEEFMEHPENAYLDLEKIKKSLDAQGEYCKAIYNSLSERKKRPADDSTFLFERAKLIGMSDAARELGMGVSDFSWIYTSI